MLFYSIYNTEAMFLRKTCTYLLCMCIVIKINHLIMYKLARIQYTCISTYMYIMNIYLCHLNDFEEFVSDNPHEYDMPTYYMYTQSTL